MNAIETKNLTKHYQTYDRGATLADTLKSVFSRKKVIVRAVNSLSFEIPEGQIVGMIGPNGAGKSTLIKMMTGVLIPTSGEISALGFSPWRQRARYTARIGAVFGQKSQLIWDIPPQDAFLMNKAIYNVPNQDFASRMKNFVELFEVGDVIRKPTRQLSLGERMKCEFIMAMLHNPEIVFLDEPTIGLDIIAKSRIHEVVRGLNSQGVTFILTTHDLEDIEKLARRVMVINHGEMVFDNDIRALRNHLGARKAVRITSSEPLPPIGLAGVRTVGPGREYETLLELDSGTVNTLDFIARMLALGTVTDISIEEPPIEEVIKVLYEKT